jgi:hypothetical protein
VEKELLLEGAVAGHMNHIYDNGEMTFGELKQLLQMAADGKLSGTEKTDGQNIFLSFNVKTGRAVAARNKGQLKQGGLDADELDSFFANHPSQALRYSFVEALEAFEEQVKNIDIDTQERIFGSDASVFFNTEVMNPGNPDAPEGDPRGKGTTNVIPYDKKTLLIHRVGHAQFDKETGKKTDLDVTPNFELLERGLVDAATEDPSIFSVETNPVRKLPPMQDKSVLKDTMEKVSNLMSDIGVSDADTINDYVIGQVVPEIDQFNLDNNKSRMLLQRVMKIPGPDGKVPGVNDVKRGLPTELASDVSAYVKGFNYASYTLDLQRVLHDFSVAMVGTIDSSFINDNDKQIQFLQDEVESTISRIKNGDNERAQAELEKQMIKLKDVGGINTPSEGFVFDFNGVTYKFTGNFAPTNQILGMERFNRFGPIDSQEAGEKPVKAETGPLTIALFPGSFKPPHKGHVLAAEALAEDADIIYIFVSAPQLSGRSLKSGATISADQAIQCWNTMIDKSPIKNKAKVMVGPEGVASPMMTAINFIQHQPSPDNLYAAPENATVILGVGAKGSDADRYGGKIMQKSKEMRPDLTVVTKAVGPFTHSQEYLNLLNEHPAIAGMLNKGRGRASSEQLSDEERLEGKIADRQMYHASDMRDFIDLAAEDPIGIEFLKDFVYRDEDVLAVLGILGVNPADDRESPEDQVGEPELDADGLREMIENSLHKMLQEEFRSQKAPKAGPSKGKFQTKMRKRLSKAHSTYLDMGRKDLTKYGGGFHLDRDKDNSNAFLAEDQEEIEEMSSMAGGNVAGYAGPIGTREEDDLKEQEKQLRKTIRIGLKEFFANKQKQQEELIEYVIQEHNLRLNLRTMILAEAASEDPTVDIADSTGINTLKDLLKNSNVLSTLRNVYKTLTTDEDQKRSFRAHIVKWTQDTLAPVRLNDTKPEGEEALSEAVGIDVAGIDTDPADVDKFIDAQDGSEKEKPEQPEEEETMTPISGADTTGRNKAERVYPVIEKSIVDYYGELDNPEDQEMFYDYLIANLKLYFDKWDGEMSKEVEEPTNDEYEQAKQAI